MKKLWWLIVLVLLGAGYMWWVGAPPFNQQATPSGGETIQKEEEAIEDAAVEIKDFAFSPATLTVKKGTTVTFTNRDIASHSVTADDGTSFETGLLGTNESGTVTFNTVGTFGYHCTP